MASLADVLKAEIFERFQHGEIFSSEDFKALRDSYEGKYISCALGKLAKYQTACIALVDQKRNGGRTTNLYRIKSVKETDYQVGDATRWHRGTPAHDCADGEVYRVRFWDRSEGLRAWRQGWWWDGDKKLARDYVMEFSGVVR